MTSFDFYLVTMAVFVVHVKMRVDRGARISYVQYCMAARALAYWAAEHSKRRQGMIIVLTRGWGV